MKTEFYIFGLCCLFLASCNNVVYEENINGNRMLVCQADKVSGEQDLLLSELVEAIEVIPLETHDSCLVKNIWKVFFTENYIGVLEHDMRPYKLFDRQGNFVTTIGRIGQGPHEYTTIISASVDEMNKRIYLMEFSRTDKLLCYDFDGNFCSNIPLCFNNLDKPSFYIKDGVITVFSMPVSNKEIFAFQQTMDGKLIQALPASEYMLAENYNEELFVACNEGKYTIFYTSLDTLFTYDPEFNRLIPEFHTKFEKDEIFINRELPDYYITSILTENRKIIVDKYTKKANYFKLKNDFLGGLEIDYFQADNDYIVVVCESSELREELEKSIDNPDLPEDIHDSISMLLKSINNEDNPVLILGKLKN